MLDLIIAPFTIDFMQQALITAVFLSVAAAVLSCFLVLRGWALMGDAISHAVLPGIVLAYAAGIPLVIGAFIAGMFCTVATGYMSENSRLKEDTVMGVVFSGMFGLGVVLFSVFRIDVHLHEILFGDILGLTWTDVMLTGVVALIASALVWFKRKDLLVHCFDPQHARAIGLPVKLLHYGLLVLLSVVIVTALKVVGIIMVIALLIAPGAIGYLMSDRFDTMLLVAVSSAVIASILGIVTSFVLDSAVAPTIVLMLMAMFVLVFIFAPLHGLIGSKRKRVESALLNSNKTDARKLAN